MTESEADLDRRVRSILSVVDEAWKLMADLDIEAKTLAIDRLTKRLALEQASNDPSVIAGRRH
jgi:hypothetical protein